MKINSLQIENVKRVRAVALEPAQNGLTVVGGRNNQGKTSVLDAIAWALGGDRYRPEQAARDGAMAPPYIKVTLDNGLVVERKGKNSALTVSDPTSQRVGQQLLNEFVEQFALDLPRFMQTTAREKAQTLLQIIGVGDRLAELENKETQLYNKRHAIGQIADQKKKYAAELTNWPDAPNAPVSASELIKRQQTILAINGENQRKRDRAAALEAERRELKRQLDALSAKYDAICVDCETAVKTAAELTDESTAALERDIADIERINIQVRANLDKEKAEEDAKEYADQYAALTSELEQTRDAKTALLKDAKLPLEGLEVIDGELAYKGHTWDCMSGSEQLRAAVAIVRALNPKCGFVLMDKLEQMDVDTLRDFGGWLEREGLQVIATRVSTGGECSIIIEDGETVIDEQSKTDIERPKWTGGTF